MYPTLESLNGMQSEMRSILDNIISGAAMSAYAGEVEDMVDRVKAAIANTENALDEVEDESEES